MDTPRHPQTGLGSASFDAAVDFTARVGQSKAEREQDYAPSGLLATESGGTFDIALSPPHHIVAMFPQ
jgi:hypothetical protein